MNSSTWSGSTVGAYVLGPLLGRGAMGEVYEAVERDDNVRVAVKLLTEALTRSPKARARFSREADAATRVLHPGVVRVLRHGFTQNDIPYIAMELLPDETLQSLLKKEEALSPDEVEVAAADILAALACIHEGGIVHRDLKPANICVLSRRPLRTKIVDFGIAHLLDEGAQTRLTTQGKVLGTPAYLAPELAKGHRPTAASDLYSFGLVLYEMTSGRRPFQGTDPLDLIRAHIAQPVPALDHAVPHHLNELIMACLAKEPEERPPTAAAARTLLLAGSTRSAAANSLEGLELQTSTHATEARSDTGDLRTVAVSGALNTTEGDVVAGKYRLETVVGRGGMGRVYRGKHVQLDRTVAVKILEPGLASRGDALERFRREAILAARLDSPHVVGVTDVEELPDGGLAIISEFADGGTLRERISRDRKLSCTEAVHIMRGVCIGLSAVHESGIVHRDIKPENVLFSRGKPKIADFGIARLHDEEARLTAAGVMLGTPRYMAPEQITGEGITFATDLYAIGVILYELLSGTSPHSGTNPHALVFEKVHERPPALRTRASKDVPDELCVLVDRLLARNPTERPSDAASVAVDLERALNHDASTAPLVTSALSTSASAVGSAHHSRPLARSQVLAVTAIVALCIAGVAVAVWSYASRSPDTHDESLRPIVTGQQTEPTTRKPLREGRPAERQGSIASSADESNGHRPESSDAERPTHAMEENERNLEPDRKTSAEVLGARTTATAANHPSGTPAEPMAEVAPDSAMDAEGAVVSDGPGQLPSSVARTEVVVDTVPAGAVVLVGGASVGRTPWTMSLSSRLGDIALEFRHPGFKPLKVNLDVTVLREAGIPRIEYRLTRAAGRGGSAVVD